LDLKTIISLLIQISLGLIVASCGLRARWHDLFGAFREPLFVLRGVFAINLVVPCVAVATMLMLPVDPIIRVGVVAMAIAPISPAVASKMRQARSEVSHAIGLYAALLLVSTAAVPATIALLRYMGAGATLVPTGDIVGLAIRSGLLPLVAGLAIGSSLPRASLRLAAAANLAGTLILLPIMAVIVWHFRDGIVALLGSGVPAAILATVAAGLAVGHCVGGASLGERQAIAGAATMRHPGIAALIVHANFDDGSAMLAVVLFLLIGVAGSALYSAWPRKISPAPVTRAAE
jgi:BASS family bile acid:Na+ symporter